MKKMTSLFLMAAMFCAMGIPASAANTTIDKNGGTSTTDVKGSYQAGTDAGTTYRVDITWGSMEFTYKAANQGSWNPETHAFDGTGQSGWDYAKGANEITLTNHSNTAIAASVDFTPGTGYAGISGSFVETSGTHNDGNLTLATAEGTPVANAPSGTVALILDGALNENTPSNTTIGTVMISITKAN